eukprot:2473897-Rhodomonas_salina.1
MVMIIVPMTVIFVEKSAARQAASATDRRVGHCRLLLIREVRLRCHASDICCSALTTAPIAKSTPKLSSQPPRSPVCHCFDFVLLSGSKCLVLHSRLVSRQTWRKLSGCMRTLGVCDTGTASGNADAMYGLARMILESEERAGQPRRTDKAAKMLATAAKTGHGDATY